MSHKELPIPPHFDPQKMDQLWQVPYQERADAALEWARQHNLQPAYQDSLKIRLMLVDVQNTFCLPGFELYVAGRSGTGAIDDNRRLCKFIYRNLGVLTQICPTLDTHQAMQIFHSLFLVDKEGRHPAPYTLVSVADVERGVWRVNPAVARSLGVTESYAQEYLLHYVRQLKAGGKYNLTIWPYHAMLGGVGHALVSAVEEAVYFHSIARYSQPDFQIKGDNPFTENYSVLKPEVLEDADQKVIAQKNDRFIEILVQSDVVIIAGQAKSHCVAWTIDDLLDELMLVDETLARKVYLLEDCTSPVVIPGVVDYTEQADAAFQRFSDAGMHVVRSVDPLENWPGLKL